MSSIHAFRTDIGCKREQNQDFGGTFPEHRCFLVADGMGGHQGGETASHLAVETVASYLSRNPDLEPRKRIADALRAANFEVYRKSQDVEELRGMGTTTTALLFSGEADATTAWIGHVGDSRCYFLQEGRMWQLTRDHSLVQEKLRAGLITPEQARTDRMKNVITRSIGFEPDVQVEVYEFKLPPDGLLLLCSDGLTGMLLDRQIKDIVDQEYFQHGSIDAAAERLIEQANAHGGDDNITALLVRPQSLQ